MRNGWHLNVFPIATPLLSRLAAEYSMPTRSESKWPIRLTGAFERLPRIGKGLAMFESLRMGTNVACRGGSDSEAERDTENTVAGTAAEDIRSRRKHEFVRTGGALNQSLSDRVKLIMPRTIHGSTRRRCSYFQQLVRVKTASGV